MHWSLLKSQSVVFFDMTAVMKGLLPLDVDLRIKLHIGLASALFPSWAIVPAYRRQMVGE